VVEKEVNPMGEEQSYKIPLQKTGREKSIDGFGLMWEKRMGRKHASKSYYRLHIKTRLGKLRCQLD